MDDDGFMLKFHALVLDIDWPLNMLYVTNFKGNKALFSEKSNSAD